MMCCTAFFLFKGTNVISNISMTPRDADPSHYTLGETCSRTTFLCVSFAGPSPSVSSRCRLEMNVDQDVKTSGKRNQDQHQGEDGDQGTV